jgi:hypothetical protein
MRIEGLPVGQVRVRRLLETRDPERMPTVWWGADCALLLDGRDCATWKQSYSSYKIGQ